MESTDDLSEGGSVEQREQGIIIGTNDLVRVAANGSNVPAKYRGFLDGFGRGVFNGALCSATHVGNGIVVSAGHCFGAGPTRQNNVSCAGGRVEFGYRDGKSPSVSNCQTILAQQTGNGKDYAIYRVSPTPPVAVPISIDARPGQGTPLTIFSHPGGRPLEWSQTCQVNSTRTTEFQYECDTQGGSSGAAVLRDDTLQVVGLHWGAVGSRNIATNLGDTPLREFMGTPPTNPPTGGSGVRLVSRHSNKCLDVSSGGSANGTNIQLWTCNGSAAQTFRVEDQGGGIVRFVNVGSNKCVDIAAAGTQNGANVQLYDCNGTGAQSFWSEDVGGGFSRVINVNSGKALDVGGWGTSDGTNIVQWDYLGGDNQKWRLESTGCSGVTFYQHTNFGGYAVTLAPGSYDYAAMVARGIANDDVSSLRVPSGCSTSLYQHSGFGGSRLDVNSDDASLVDNGWNDEMSSVIVR